MMAAYDRFYKGDIAEEFVRGCQEQGGLITMQDLAMETCGGSAADGQLQGN